MKGQRKKFNLWWFADLSLFSWLVCQIVSQHSQLISFQNSLKNSKTHTLTSLSCVFIRSDLAKTISQAKTPQQLHSNMLKKSIYLLNYFFSIIIFVLPIYAGLCHLSFSSILAKLLFSWLSLLSSWPLKVIAHGVQNFCPS